ncbi:MAG: hypothetical protein U5L45_09945 [Saprospiraceae bacterium]|nr:hypothetical protein [Saprospiraceae bacterium]
MFHFSGKARKMKHRPPSRERSKRVAKLFWLFDNFSGSKKPLSK